MAIRGTYLVLLWRPNCVIIASDTAAHDGERQVEGIHHKILCHPKLPLAIAIGGTASFELNGQNITVEGLLRIEFEVWATAGRVTVHTVKAWAEKVLGPLIRDLNTEPGDGLPPADVTLLVGLCRGNSADSMALEIKPTGVVQVGKVNSPVVYPTASLVGWTQNTLLRREDVFGAKLQDVDQIIGRMRPMIPVWIVA